MQKISSLILVLLALVPALMGSNCNVTAKQSLELMHTELTIEGENYNLMLVEQNQVKTWRNDHWEVFSNAYMEWANSIEVATKQLTLLNEDLVAEGEQSRAELASDLALLQTRLDALFTRPVNLGIIVEPWTAYLISRTRTEILNSLAQMQLDYAAIFGVAAPSVASWNITLTDDQNPTRIYPMVMDMWKIESDYFCTGAGHESRCLLPNNAQVALRVFDTYDQVVYLHKENQTIGVNLGYTTTRELAVTIEKQPGATGNVLYNEPVALKFNGGGYLIHRQRSDFAVDLTFTSTPTYEWKIVPKWSRLSGLDVDTRVWFALRNVANDRLLMPCDQTAGVSLGWNTFPGSYPGDIGCE